MNLNKAIKKQRKSYIVFVLLMSFIFIVFPCIIISNKLYSYIIYIYICVLEFFILLAILTRIDEESLLYKHKLSKFYIRNGLFNRTYVFNCEDLNFVHVTGTGENIKVILLIKSKKRNKSLKEVTKKFIKCNPYVGDYYYNLFKVKPDLKYYYIIIKRGKYKKYLLINKLYSSCFNAFYSEDVIKYIKENKK